MQAIAQRASNAQTSTSTPQPSYNKAASIRSSVNTGSVDYARKPTLASFYMNTICDMCRNASNGKNKGSVAMRKIVSMRIRTQAYGMVFAIGTSWDIVHLVKTASGSIYGGSLVRAT
jgi:hypothetical protein